MKPFVCSDDGAETKANALRRCCLQAQLGAAAPSLKSQTGDERKREGKL